VVSGRPGSAPLSALRGTEHSTYHVFRDVIPERFSRGSRFLKNKSGFPLKSSAGMTILINGISASAESLGVVGSAEQPEEEYCDEYPANGGSTGHFPLLLSLVDGVYLLPDGIELFPDGG
jgi:hypothetical protein